MNHEVKTKYEFETDEHNELHKGYESSDSSWLNPVSLLEVKMIKGELSQSTSSYKWDWQVWAYYIKLGIIES